MSLADQMAGQDARIQEFESMLADFAPGIRKLIASEVEKRWVPLEQQQTMSGAIAALVVSTIDPLKQGRVRIYTPLLHRPDTPAEHLPFASPVSALGGFDDSGAAWVPPSGATVMVIFENGDRRAPYYLGTTWHRNRGADGRHNWGYPLAEYEQLHSGDRGGYLVGSDNGSQVLPPWNTESYNGIDFDSVSDFERDTNAQAKMTFPNIYGLKTPQKHMLKFVDGDYRCEHKWKRVELMSGGGNWLMMKDDPMHDGGSWTHPSLRGGGSEAKCPPVNANVACGSELSTNRSNRGEANPYFKNASEGRPYTGPRTPQNNRCDLDQTGIQLLSIGGHTIVMDDSVDQPRGGADWQDSMQPFDFGCNNKFRGRFYMNSATGHHFEMSDIESQPMNRGVDNFIRLRSAAGNLIELNDDTLGRKVAGTKRGVEIRSTSNHLLEMRDEGNEQRSPVRAEGGIPVSRAKRAFVRLRSGYGLELMMRDDSDQENTQSQSIQLTAPQRDAAAGPHILRFQEQAGRGGQVFLRAGGDYLCSVYGSSSTIVGGGGGGDRIVTTAGSTFSQTTRVYINKAASHIFQADGAIVLQARGPVFPVCCLVGSCITASSTVFASCLGPPCSIKNLKPF